MALITKPFAYCPVIDKDKNDGLHYDYHGKLVTEKYIDDKRVFQYENGDIVETYMERVTSLAGSRYYATPTGNLKSVTTILDATGDKSGLIAWQKRVGEKEAERVRVEATKLGSLMHTHLENHLMGIERPGGNNLIRKMARSMADVIIESGLCNLDEVWGMEEGLYFPGVYAGTADLIGVFRGKESIIDYKSARKLKSEKMIENYLAQGAAYSLAHNELFGTNISSIVILMADRENKFREFHVTGQKFQKYMDIWMRRIEIFYTDKQAA